MNGAITDAAACVVAALVIGLLGMALLRDKRRPIYKISELADLSRDDIDARIGWPQVKSCIGPVDARDFNPDAAPRLDTGHIYDGLPDQGDDESGHA